MVIPAAVSVDACHDADDLPILGAAIAGSADCIVTGDADLLTLNLPGGIPILSPRDFYNRLR